MQKISPVNDARIVSEARFARKGTAAGITLGFGTIALLMMGMGSRPAAWASVAIAFVSAGMAIWEGRVPIVVLRPDGITLNLDPWTRRHYSIDRITAWVVASSKVGLKVVGERPCVISLDALKRDDRLQLLEALEALELPPGPASILLEPERRRKGRVAAALIALILLLAFLSGR